MKYHDVEPLGGPTHLLRLTGTGGHVPPAAFPFLPVSQVHSRFVTARMRSLQALYPYSSRRTYFKKLFVTLGACGLQSETVMKGLLRFCQ